MQLTRQVWVYAGTAVRCRVIEVAKKIAYLTLHIPLFVASITIGDNGLSSARFR
jgi:hypothetical protein